MAVLLVDLSGHQGTIFMERFKQDSKRIDLYSIIATQRLCDTGVAVNEGQRRRKVSIRQLQEAHVLVTQRKCVTKLLDIMWCVGRYKGESKLVFYYLFG